MEHPKVPVYVYPYTHKPTYVIKICDYKERIETSQIYAYYTICCTIGKPNTYRPNVCFVRLISSVMDTVEPVYYISASLAAKLLRTSLQHLDHDPYLHGYLATAIQKGTSLAQQYQSEFDEYAKKLHAIKYIQRVYLQNYYDPSRPFCKKRLHSHVKEFNNSILGRN